MEQELRQGQPGASGGDNAGASQREVAQDPPNLVAGEETSRQPERKPVDLTQFEEFRNFQSKVDRDMAALRREAQEAKQRAKTERQQLRQQRLAQMDDYERAVFERDEYRSEVENYRQQIEEVQAQQYRNERVAEIRAQVRQETGVDVPADSLDLSSPDAAVASAYSYAVQSLKGKQSQSVQDEARQLAQRQQANHVDLGGGAPNTADARYRAQQRQILKERRPAVDFYKSALRAAREGQ